MGPSLEKRSSKKNPVITGGTTRDIEITVSKIALPGMEDLTKSQAIYNATGKPKSVPKAALCRDSLSA